MKRLVVFACVFTLVCTFRESGALTINDCVGFTCRSGECTGSIFNRCNGVEECSDGSDESQCTFCPSGYYCTNGQCTTYIRNRCDGSCDCSDCNDENNCTLTETGITRNIVSIAVGSAVAVFIVVICIPITIVLIIVCIVAGVAGTVGSRSRASRNPRTVVATGYEPGPPSMVAGSTTVPPPNLQLQEPQCVQPHQQPLVEMEPYPQPVPSSVNEYEDADDKVPVLPN